MDLQQVCAVLLERGRLTFGEVRRYARGKIGQVRECLLVLVQHNLVKTYLVATDGTVHGPRRHLYEADVEQILVRLRHPKFLLHTKDTLGEEAESVVQALLENGRLRMSQVLSSVAAKWEVTEESIADKLKVAFLSLLERRMVERAPDGNQHPPPCKEPFGLRRNRPGRGLAEAMAHKSEGKQREKTAEETQATRFHPPDMFVDAPRTSVQNPARRKRRKLNQIADDEDEEPPQQETLWQEGNGCQVLWRVNTEEFNRQFRHELIGNTMAAMYGEKAGVLVKTMLKLSSKEETHVKDETTVLLTAEDIAKACSKQTEVEPHLSYSEALDMLEFLSMERPGFLSRFSTNTEVLSYTLCLGKIIHHLKVKHVEGVVMQKFGDRGCRIFRLLLAKRMLEQKQVADAAMLPIRDAREELYKLMKEELVSVQEVPKTSDRAPARTFYLFYIDLPAVLRNITAEMYRSLSNIRARLEHELRQEEEVLGLLDAVADKDNENSSSYTSLILTSTQRHQVEQVRKTAILLETLMGRLDDLIALFDNF